MIFYRYGGWLWVTIGIVFGVYVVLPSDMAGRYIGGSISDNEI